MGKASHRLCGSTSRPTRALLLFALLAGLLVKLTLKGVSLPSLASRELLDESLAIAASKRDGFDVQREVDKLILDKLGRYELFEQSKQGGGQPPGAWYQDNAEPIYTCVHAERIGPHGEGGKWMCNPNQFRDGTPCLIYSIGSQDDFRWEKAILDRVSKDCEIHVFDHTVLEPKTKPTKVQYHSWGLTSSKLVEKNMKTLQSIVRELGHENRVIDVLKIDCEGCEWETFSEWFDAGVTINEILVELHTGTSTPPNNPPAKDFMAFMIANDMLIHHKEPNVKYSGFDSLCVEFAFVRFEGIAYSKTGDPRKLNSTQGKAK